MMEPERKVDLEMTPLRSLGTRDSREWWEVLVTVPKADQGGGLVDAPALIDELVKHIGDQAGINVLRLGWKDDTHLWVQGPKKAESKP